MGQADLPLGSGKAHVKAFQRAGWELLPRRGRGSHFLLRRTGFRGRLSIPDHAEVKRALLAKQVKLAGLTEDEYSAYYDN